MVRQGTPKMAWSMSRSFGWAVQEELPSWMTSTSTLQHPRLHPQLRRASSFRQGLTDSRRNLSTSGQDWNSVFGSFRIRKMAHASALAVILDR